MSVSTINVIVGRIESATPESPIAVFRHPLGKEGTLEAVFGDTVKTRHRVARQNDPLFVGLFHRDMAPRAVAATLRKAVRHA